jgi:hypothetical protein
MQAVIPYLMKHADDDMVEQIMELVSLLQ